MASVCRKGDNRSQGCSHRCRRHWHHWCWRRQNRTSVEVEGFWYFACLKKTSLSYSLHVEKKAEEELYSSNSRAYSRSWRKWIVIIIRGSSTFCEWTRFCVMSSRSTALLWHHNFAGWFSRNKQNLQVQAPNSMTPKSQNGQNNAHARMKASRPATTRKGDAIVSSTL